MLFSAEKTSKWVKTVFDFILDLIFPKLCLGCKKEGEYLCMNCFGKIELSKHQVCPICYKGDSSAVCGACISSDLYLDGLICATSFAKNILLRKCIHVYKYEFVEELAIPLAKILVLAFMQLKDNEDCKHFSVICAVPLHPKRLRFRGFNQAELLAEEFIKATHLKFKIINFVQRIHFRMPQMQLSREMRLKNAENAFVFNPKYNKNIDSNLPNLPETILLIDDVATTLATLNSCAKSLKMAGVKKIYGLVLARVF